MIFVCHRCTKKVKKLHLDYKCTKWLLISVIISIFASVFWNLGGFGFGESVPNIPKLCSEVDGHTGKSEKQIFQEIIIKDISKVLFDLKAPHHLTDGSVLNLIRSCNVSAPDVDFAVDLDWLEKKESLFLAEIGKLGYKVSREFGKGQYEFGREFTIKNTDHAHVPGAYADIFGAKFFEESVVCEPLWPSGCENIECTLACCSRMKNRKIYNWNSVLISLPDPYDLFLSTMYGKDWKVPKRKGYSNCAKYIDAINGKFQFAYDAINDDDLTLFSI